MCLLPCVRTRYWPLALLSAAFGAVPNLGAHPHEPHPLAPPKEGSIATPEAAAALPVEARIAIVDGSHHPGAATRILKTLATKPHLRELKIYGATKWPENSLAPLRSFGRLEVLRIFDDSTRRKPGFLQEIAKVRTLKTLQLYYSGD